MRKDSWFRGALLSVLFFAPLIGGAPTMAGAIHTNGGITPGSGGESDANRNSGTNANGEFGGNSGSLWNSFTNFMCGASENLVEYSIIGAGVGIAATAFPEPASMLTGPGLISASGIGATLGFMGQAAFC
ncbi:MAG: hypothetical protein F4210_15800 [Holophagales bacterium]|nr:hypothetical protein [Holophagales bacterium]MYF96934.1 hypothetical protein [Holophagales bacterium]